MTVKRKKKKGAEKKEVHVYISQRLIGYRREREEKKRVVIYHNNQL
jgi:hypothetical protein